MLAGELGDLNERNDSSVVACSALKKAYRGIPSKDIIDFHIVYLKGDFIAVESASGVARSIT